MPPWSADPASSLKFRNDPRLSGADIATLSAWARAGAPQGKYSGAPKFSSETNLARAAGEWHGPDGRQPDLVISMDRETQVPASGDLAYVRFLVKVPLSGDKWVAACEARPGNATVVHHMAITEVELPEGVRPGDVDGLEAFARTMGSTGSILRPAVMSASNPNLVDMLAIYTPGATLETYPPDSGKLLRGGANRYIDFNIHYTSHGTAATDRSEVAFWFRDMPPKHQIIRTPLAAETIIANGKELLTDARGIKAEGTQMVIPPIPPGTADYELIAVTAFPQPVTIFQLQPHAHLRGKAFTYTAVYPDGREETLLSVPQYDFRWQMAYELETPLKLPAGSKLVVTGHYDNSANNRFNPAPEKSVFFRDQNLSTDEMFSPFVQYSVDAEEPGVRLVQTTGCLVQEQQSNEWMLTGAADPVASKVQTFAAREIQKAARAPWGSGTIHLVGLSVFNPSQHRQERVAVKGVLVSADERSVNVSSLQAVAGDCSSKN
jgi:hypothetical protein